MTTLRVVNTSVLPVHDTQYAIMFPHLSVCGGWCSCGHVCNLVRRRASGPPSQRTMLFLAPALRPSAFCQVQDMWTISGQETDPIPRIALCAQAVRVLLRDQIAETAQLSSPLSTPACHRWNVHSYLGARRPRFNRLAAATRPCLRDVRGPLSC
ncbi:hypothetical protein BC834DRAFT_155845 [Gloeopeniophorella convolvens]|nr:hypothetical protein BC834DRAFT_155845 [Gloeopeniophorella convolvens]